MNKQKSGGRLKRTGVWILRVLLVQLILINISAAFHAAKLTHFYDDESVRNSKPSSGTIFLRTWRLMTGKKYPKSQIGYFPYRPYDTVFFTTKNGLKIEAWQMNADSSKGTVILFHGLGSNKGDILNEAYEFLNMGYNTLLVDFRAHGNSEGSVCTLGFKESEEVQLAFDYIKNKGEKNIVLWGMSMGSAVIAKAIYDYDLHPQKIILDMPFASLQDHLRARARVLGFPPEPFAFFVTFWTGAERGYWGYGYRVSKYVSKINCPVLLQWGKLDVYVTEREIQQIFNGITQPGKKLVIYEKSGHVPLVWSENEKWKNETAAFLK